MTIKLCPLQSSAAFVYGAMSFTEKLANGLAVVLIQRYNPWYELFTQIAKVSKRHYFLLLFDILKNIYVRNNKSLLNVLKSRGFICTILNTARIGFIPWHHHIILWMSMYEQFDASEYNCNWFLYITTNDDSTVVSGFLFSVRMALPPT